MRRQRQEGLRKRGQISEADLHSFRRLSDDELVTYLTAPNATERTAAAHLITTLTPAIVEKLLVCLADEPALYTRLGICRKLAEGDREVATQLLGYLGDIGNNHYTVPGERPSKKTSYPLPRDLIARTLGKMTPDVSHVLFSAATTLKAPQLSELIDGIGFMVFYHQELATPENYLTIQQLVNKYRGNVLIEWKLISCLSAFPASQEILTEYAKLPGILGQEAQRSLALLQLRTLPDIFV